MIYAKKAKFTSGLLCGVLLCFLSVTPAYAVFINEIHYDNDGVDVGEKIELSGAAGVDLSGWSLVFYNGKNFYQYSDSPLTGVFSDLQNGLGVLSFGVSSLQNGPSDGIALVDHRDNVIQFLSYEGIITAEDGIAMGMTSTDIGVAEVSATFIDLPHSLQLTGSGREYADFSWAGPMENTFGEINQGQRFLAATTDLAVPRSSKSVSVPAPSSLVLLLLGLFVYFALKALSLNARLISLRV